MKPFEFKGHWELEYQFDACKGFQSRRGSYTSMDSKKESDGKVNLTIMDELNDDPDPLPEQIAAINFLIEQPELIKATLLKAVESIYPQLKKDYGYDPNDEDARAWFPPVDSLEGYSKVFGVGNVFIHPPFKDGYAYVGFECGCTWDEEHGLGILLHKDRLIAIGGADEAFRSWKAHKDNGTYEEIKNKKPSPQSSKKHQPHPKYNILKPSQKFANNYFEVDLIRLKRNEEFITLAKKGEIDIHGKADGTVRTFFEDACLQNNLELVEFMFNNGVNVGKGLLQCATGINFSKSIFDFLIANGVDINTENSEGETITYCVFKRLASHYSSKYNNIKSGGGRLPIINEDIKTSKDTIRYLMDKGASLTIKDNLARDYYRLANNLSEPFKSEMNDFIKKLFNK